MRGCQRGDLRAGTAERSMADGGGLILEHREESGCQ